MKLAIFDIDGTITNTNAVDERCFLSAFSEYLDIDIRQNRWQSFRHVTESNIAEEIFENVMGRKPSEKEYQDLIELFVNKLREELQSNPEHFEEVSGVKSFFNHLIESEHFHVSIATGSWSSSAELKLDAIQLDYSDIPLAHCDDFITREEITLDAIRKSKLKYEREFDDIIYFGDGIWDFKTCRNLGIRFIGIDCNKTGVLSMLGAKHVFHDYSKKEEIVKVLRNGI